MTITPDMNTGENIFVFGSNELGVHGAGAAKEALNHWGAIPGVGVGLTGHSYAIPTKDFSIKTLPLPVIAFYVSRFLVLAEYLRNKKFLITPIGTGLAGYYHKQIAPMFRDAPANCTLPEEWKELLK